MIVDIDLKGSLVAAIQSILVSTWRKTRLISAFGITAALLQIQYLILHSTPLKTTRFLTNR
jgi:hypothetical protein